MAVISLEAASRSVPAIYNDPPKKPLSLKVYETAIPILKTLSVIFEIAADCSIAFIFDGLLTANPALTTISLIVFAVTAILSIALGCLERKLSEKLEGLNDPEWARYFSLAYLNRPLEDLIAVLPDRKVWKKLGWNGLQWKQKILPYAEANGMDRKALKQEFRPIFNLFTPYMYHYYRKIELPILQTQGFHAFLAKAGDSQPKTIRDEEMRAQLLKETQGLSSAQIEEQYPNWVEPYLIPQEDPLCQLSS